MPDTYTPILALVKPEVGASRDTWGSKWNANADALDEFVSMAMPLGAILDYAGPNAPPGWLICDGRLVSRLTYAALFAVIGTYWGAGDGSTTFALPNANGRAAIGPGTMRDEAGVTYTFGFTSLQGFVYQTIDQAHLPNYALPTDYQGNHSHGGATAPGGNHNHGADVQGYHSHGDWTAVNDRDHTHGGTTDAQGAHQHNYTAPRIQGGFFIGGNASLQISDNQTLQTDVQGNHQHNIATYGASTTHLHQIYGDGSHSHNIGYSGNLQLGIYADGNHAHNVYLNGGGVALKILSPVMVVTKIIYAGQQAAVLVGELAAPTLALADERDELAAIREELAALRALFAPARRVLSAPMRGPH